MSTFHEANARGKAGEAVVKAWLESRGWLVIDTSDHPLFRSKDIDMVIARGRKVRCIDVKTDSHNSPNFFIETMSNVERGTKGCIYQTEADDWFYYYSATDTLKIFSCEDMRQHIASDYAKRYRRVNARSTLPNGSYYHSEGILVPNSVDIVKQTVQLS